MPRIAKGTKLTLTAEEKAARAAATQEAVLDRRFAKSVAILVVDAAGNKHSLANYCKDNLVNFRKALRIVRIQNAKSSASVVEVPSTELLRSAPKSITWICGDDLSGYSIAVSTSRPKDAIVAVKGLVSISTDLKNWTAKPQGNVKKAKKVKKEVAVEATL